MLNIQFTILDSNNLYRLRLRYALTDYLSSVKTDHYSPLLRAPRERK